MNELILNIVGRYADAMRKQDILLTYRQLDILGDLLEELCYKIAPDRSKDESWK